MATWHQQRAGYWPEPDETYYKVLCDPPNRCAGVVTGFRDRKEAEDYIHSAEGYHPENQGHYFIIAPKTVTRHS